MFRFYLFGFLGMIASVTNAEAISQFVDHSRDQSRYVSWQGVEPDKWATVWLIKRHLDSNAYFQFYPPHTSVQTEGIPFDLPGAALRPQNNLTMFRQLLREAALDLPELIYIDEIIHELEANIWQKNTHPHASWFEFMFRGLQERYGRDSVPVDCYLEFFDRLSELSKSKTISAELYQNSLNLSETCPGAEQQDSAFIPQVSQKDVLRAIAMGKNVVLVDTRETGEYLEVHLPNAQHIRLRDVDESVARSLDEADLVVPYCVKDFRAFEVAKALKQRGVETVATLSPNGLKGWLGSGLPVYRQGEYSDAEASADLMRCAVEPTRCLGEH